MKTITRNIIVIGLTAALFVAAASFILYSMLDETLPCYEDTLYMHGLERRTEIWFDSLAVPYVYAENENDAAFSIGYLHASERMFQMEMRRRAGEGRLSEIIGPAMVPFDKMFRTIGLAGTVEKIWQEADNDTRSRLEAYAAGVNAWIEENKTELPPEFMVFDYVPEPWTPQHSLLIIRLMAWQLNLPWFAEIAFANIAEKKSPELLRELLPFEYDFTTGTGIVDSLFKESDFHKTMLSFREFMGWSGSQTGSNNWVVDGAHSASGKPLLANDPHLPLEIPAVWYLAVINDGSHRIAGYTIPGTPAVAIGQNGSIAWGITNVMADDSDFYMETLDSSGTRYLFENEWRDLTLIKDTIVVKDSANVIMTAKRTHRGPLVTPTHLISYAFGDSGPAGLALSMRWLGNEVSDEFYAFDQLNKAENWEEFREALSYFKTPGQNFVYADTAGNIGLLCAAGIPDRGTTQPPLVADGRSARYDWQGLIPFEQMPRFYNPDEGKLASANSDPGYEAPFYMTYWYEPDSRYLRIQELLAGGKRHTALDFKRYQLDVISPYARAVTPCILHAFKGVKIKDDNLEFALERFEDWDYSFDAFKQTPAVYAFFLKHLLRNTYADELGEDLFYQYCLVANVPYRSMRLLLERPDAIPFDDVTTAKREDRDEIIRKSLAGAIGELEQRKGTDPQLWQWGQIHSITFKHPFSGQADVLDRFINVGPYGIGGDGTTVFNTEYMLSDFESAFTPAEFSCRVGPSMRFIIDMAEPHLMHVVLPLGQSGNVMSDHYSDMTPLWVRGRYAVIDVRDASAKSADNSKLTLLPRSALIGNN